MLVYFLIRLVNIPHRDRGAMFISFGVNKPRAVRSAEIIFEEYQPILLRTSERRNDYLGTGAVP